MKKGRLWPRKYELNEDFFDHWSHEMAYLMGFIMADGNIYKRTLAIGIQKRDRYVLDFFIKHIGKVPVVFRDVGKHGSYTIKFNSVKIKDSLAKYGVEPCKSKTIRISFQVPKEYATDLVRGIFDGDGWVYCRRNSIECGIVSASNGFLDDIRAITGIGGRIRTRFRDGYPSPIYLWELGTTKSKQLRDFMYQNDPKLFLARKKDIFFSNFYHRSARWWTQEQLDLLKNNWDKPLKDLPKIVGRSYKAISKLKWEWRCDGIAPGENNV